MSDDDIPNVIVAYSHQHVCEPLNMSQLFQIYLEIGGFQSNTERTPTKLDKLC